MHGNGIESEWRTYNMRCIINDGNLSVDIFFPCKQRALYVCLELEYSVHCNQVYTYRGRHHSAICMNAKRQTPSPKVYTDSCDSMFTSDTPFWTPD